MITDAAGYILKP